MALDLVALAAATAKLINLGIDGWKAGKAEGWGVLEAKVFGDALASVSAFTALLGRDKGGPLETYCALLTVAFGDAWRSHWAGNDRLAPRFSTLSRPTWLLSAQESNRVKQIESALRAGRFEVALGNAARADFDLLEDLRDPVASHWYRALWQAFMDNCAREAAVPLLEMQSGQDRRQFERDVRLAFAEGLAAENSRALRAWLGTNADEQAQLLRVLLAAGLSNFRTEHIFGSYDDTSGVPRLRLEDIYVEPFARRPRAGELSDWAARNKPVQPALALLRELLKDEAALLIVVAADFGRGKSLTARTLAWMLADDFLDVTHSVSTELWYPIFVQCQFALKRGALDVESIIRSAVKRQLEQVLPTVDITHRAFHLPQHQATVVILDGLDEVQLDAKAVKELFASLRVAWKAHVLQQQSPGTPFTAHDVKGVLAGLHIDDTELSLVTQGVLLTLGTGLGDDDPEVYFTHKSFREFLVAKYWESRIRRVCENAGAVSSQLALCELANGRLFVRGDQSQQFLIELCRLWPPENRHALVKWAEVQFNDETLSTTALRGDTRYILREVALSLGSCVHAGTAALQVATQYTLQSLCAISALCTGETFVIAPGLDHPNARLQGMELSSANLQGANLEGATLERANLDRADLHDANLKKANLQRANLQGANLEGANLEGANLRGANLYRASLHRANLRDAVLEDAHLELARLQSANLRGAHLEGANLQSASLQRTNLESASVLGAVYNSETLFDDTFDPRTSYMRYRDEQGSSDDGPLSARSRR